MMNALALIIEDDQKLATIFARTLQMANFETEVLFEGRSASNRLKEVIPAIIMLDLHLPFVSGEEILHQIRADTRFDDTQVILATADALTAVKFRKESDLVLIKPINLIQLHKLAIHLRFNNGKSRAT